MIRKKLLSTIAFAFVILFSGCAEDDFNKIDGVCPVVSSTNPIDLATDVPINQVISAKFNEKMNPSTITEASFIVAVDNILIDGTVSYTDSTAIFTPSNLLEENVKYTSTINTSVKDLRGNALQEDYVWTFVTVPPLPMFSVEVSSNLALGGVTSGVGLFDQGTVVTVTAVPNVGYTFVNWTMAGIEVSINSNYIFTLIENTTLVANYALIPPVQFTVNLSSSPVEGGSTSGSGSFVKGTNVTASATAKTGYTFVNWTLAGVEVSTNSNLTFTLNENRTLVANYAVIPPTQFTVNLSSNPVEGGSTSGSGSFVKGTNVTVSATVKTGYTFVNWTLAGVEVSTNSNYTFALNANTTLVAKYALIPPTQFTVNLSSNPVLGGSASGSGSFVAGTNVSVSATAATGYTFVNWTLAGVEVSTNSNYTFALNANRTLVANYVLTTPSQFTVNLSSSPAVGGTTTGSGSYVQGTNVRVSATAAIGYTFVNWTLAGIEVSTNAFFTFPLNENRTLVANFEVILPNQFAVNLSSNPVEAGTTNGSGLFVEGIIVTVSATPKTGYTFVNWTMAGVSVSNNANFTFAIHENRTLVANYALLPPTQYVVNASALPVAGGTTNGSGTFVSGTNVTVTATVKTGYNFVNWTLAGVAVSTNSNYTFVVNSNKTLVANFIAATSGFTLNVTAQNGSVNKNPNNSTYNSGANVILTPTPNSGYVFTSWSGDATGNNNPLTVTMNGNKNITANFTLVTVGSYPVGIDLGSAGAFAILGGSGVSNTGTSTVITGNVGSFPTATMNGLLPSNVIGTLYTSADPIVGLAKTDLTTAYNDAQSRSINAISLPGQLGGLTLAPGLYVNSSTSGISGTGANGILTLDAGGDANAVWVFKMGSTLITDAGTKIVLAGGAKASNIYWSVGTSATLGTNSIFYGNILADQSITLTTGAVLNGRALTRIAAVTLDSNSVTKP